MLAIVNMLFDGFAFGMLLFVITVGLSVTMGVMNFSNLAHGAFAMAGGYLAVVLVNDIGLPFLLMLPLVFLAITLLGLLSERYVFRRFYTATHLQQVLLSIGIVFMATAVARYFFGPFAIALDMPTWLSATLPLDRLVLPVYRIAVILIGLALALILWIALERTLAGAKLRAAVANPNMARAIGIPVTSLLSWVFATGAGLAGLGGALSVDLLGLTPTYALDYLALVLLIVIIGGLGSIRGAFAASVLIGIIDNAGKFFFPEIGAFLVYAIAFAILLFRPSGLVSRV